MATMKARKKYLAKLRAVESTKDTRRLYRELKERRLHRGLSLSAVGKTMRLNQSTIYRWEEGLVDVPAYKLVAWREAIDATVRAIDATKQKTA